MVGRGNRNRNDNQLGEEINKKESGERKREENYIENRDKCLKYASFRSIQSKNVRRGGGGSSEKSISKKGMIEIHNIYPCKNDLEMRIFNAKNYLSYNN